MDPQSIDFIFSILILIMSIVVHEVSHGYAADVLGDPTARLSGRLTLNPINHLEVFGSLILPTISYLVGGFIFGWAKPVPYNPYNLRNQRWGTAIVASAGVVANFFIAFVFGMLIKYSDTLGISSPEFYSIASTIVFLNIILGLFNLIPVPPLDGSKLLFSILPAKFYKVQEFLEANWPIMLILVLLFVWKLIAPIASILFNVFTGVGF